MAAAAAVAWQFSQSCRAQLELWPAARRTHFHVCFWQYSATRQQLLQELYNWLQVTSAPQQPQRHYRNAVYSCCYGQATHQHALSARCSAQYCWRRSSSSSSGAHTRPTRVCLQRTLRHLYQPTQMNQSSLCRSLMMVRMAATINLLSCYMLSCICLRSNMFSRLIRLSLQSSGVAKSTAV